MDGTRIDSGSGTQPMVADDMEVESTPTDATSAAQKSDEGDGVDPNFFSKDCWDQTPDGSEDFMTQMTGGDTGKSAASAPPKGRSMSVLDLQAAHATGEVAAKSSGPVGSKLSSILEDSSIDFDEIEHSADNAHAFGPIDRAVAELAQSDPRALAQFAKDPAEVRKFVAEHLEDRSDIPGDNKTERQEHIDKAADSLVDEMQQHVVDGFEHRLADRVGAIVRKASEPYKAINSSKTSRRAFLAQLAQLEGDKGKLSARLHAFGLDKDAANDIAGVLAKAHGNPAAIAALRDGAAGPDREGMLEFGNEYDFADETLQDQLDDKLDGLQSLENQVQEGSINEKVLLDPNFKLLRDKVLTEMDGGEDGPVKEVVEQVTEDVETDETISDVLKIGISTVTAVGLTVVTGGLAGPAALAAVGATEGAESAPEVMVAMDNVDLAELANQKELVMPDGRKVSIGMTDDETVEDARYNRNLAVGMAVAGMVLGAAEPVKGMVTGAEEAEKSLARKAIEEGAKSAALHTIGKVAEK